MVPWFYISLFIFSSDFWKSGLAVCLHTETMVCSLRYTQQQRCLACHTAHTTSLIPGIEVVCSPEDQQRGCRWLSGQLWHSTLFLPVPVSWPSQMQELYFLYLCCNQWSIVKQNPESEIFLLISFTIWLSWTKCILRRLVPLTVLCKWEGLLTPWTHRNNLT